MEVNCSASEHHLNLKSIKKSERGRGTDWLSAVCMKRSTLCHISVEILRNVKTMEQSRKQIKNYVRYQKAVRQLLLWQEIENWQLWVLIRRNDVDTFTPTYTPCALITRSYSRCTQTQVRHTISITRFTARPTAHIQQCTHKHPRVTHIHKTHSTRLRGHIHTHMNFFLTGTMEM